MSLDDWGFPDHRSQVEKCSFDIGDGPIECEQIERDKHAVEKRTDDISIKPGQELKIVMKGVEIHRNDDSLRMFHAYAAKNPIVELRMPSDFYANCSFGVPDERITPSVLDHLYRLDGTQFPGQCTYIRWHKRGNVAQHPKS
jgi:hypothetical protein